MAAIWSVNPNDGVEGGNGSFIFPRNESEQDKTYTVTYSDGDKVCSKTVVVMARSIDCCNEITVNEPSDMIPANGITATTAITTFTSTCGFDGITVRGSNGLTVSTNNGTIYIDSCDENEDEETKDYTIYIDYNGSECKTITITQEGGIKCECSSMSKFIDVTQRIYGNNRQENVLIATADTQGCGEVSAKTNSNMLEGRELVREEIGDYQYAFKATITQNTTSSNRSADINLYFKKKGSSGYDDCYNYALTILQTQNPPTCESMTFTGDLVNTTETLDSSSEYEMYASRLFMNYDGSFSSDNPESYYAMELTATVLRNGVEVQENAVKSYRIQKNTIGGYYDSLNDIIISENTQSTERTIVLRFTAYHSVVFKGRYTNYTNEDWEGGTPCTSCTLTLIQPKALEECECSDYYLRFVTNSGGDLSELRLHRNVNREAFYIKPEGISQDKPCPKILPDRYSFSIRYNGDDNFITSVEFIRYNTFFGLYEFEATFAENPTSEKHGTITVCLVESGQECGCNTLTVVKTALNNCTDCDQDVKRNIKVSTSIKPNGGAPTNYSIVILDDICAYKYNYYLCDVNGNETTYDWINNLSFHTSTFVTDYIFGNVEPNMTNSPRTAYIAVIPLKDDGITELIPGCKAIVNFTQPNMNECSCSNLVNDAKAGTSYDVSSSVFYVGQTDVKIAEVTVTALYTNVSCIDLNVTTTQGYFTENHYVTNPRTGRTDLGAYGYYVWKRFDIHADIINGTGSPLDAQGVSAAIDYQVKINGTECDGLNGRFSILIKERQS